jgi:GcrA cell cycle regulator
MEANMSWDESRIEQLKKLWADGLSASQIAAELGGVTRNAVIGKVHRLGLSGRAKAKTASAVRTRTKTVVVKQQRVQTQTIVTRGNLAMVEMVDAVAQPVVQQQRENVVIPMSRRISIMELREGVCRWPLGDPLTAEFAYCGADCAMGKTYCEAHARVAFQPQNERRRTN